VNAGLRIEWRRIGATFKTVRLRPWYCNFCAPCASNSWRTYTRILPRR